MDKASPYKFVDDSSDASPMPKFVQSDKKTDKKEQIALRENDEQNDIKMSIE